MQEQIGLELEKLTKFYPVEEEEYISTLHYTNLPRVTSPPPPPRLCAPYVGKVKPPLLRRTSTKRIELSILPQVLMSCEFDANYFLRF